MFFIAGKIIRPIAESYEKQKRFITDAGHEIKTPLTIINANVASRNSSTGGHGIGLSVAKAIVVSHGGKITAITDDKHSFRVDVVFSQ